MTLIQVEPIRKESTKAFIEYANGGGYEETVSVLRYPDSVNGQKLYEYRQRANLSIRDAIRTLGIRPSELCGLETGKFGLSPEDWIELFEALGL